MSKILVYCGTNYGTTLDTLYKKFDKCYAFEANPELVKKLIKKYANIPNIEIIEGALSDTHNEKVKFYITRHIGVSTQTYAASSLGEPSDFYRKNGPKNQIVTDSVIQVTTINLYTFLQERKIKKIHTYVSDLQGMDLTILKTLTYYVNNKLIENIAIETECDYWEEDAYIGLPSNKQNEIIDFLSDNYTIIGKQNGLYDKDNPKRWFYQDVFFKLK